MAMLNNQRVSFLFMSSDVSCQKYPNPAGYEPCQTAAEKSNGPFFDPPIFGAVLKTSVRDVAVTVKVSVMFFFARHHDQPRHRSDMNFTFGHWNIEIENWLVVSNIWIIFPVSWECHHPNWRSPSFFRGVVLPPTWEFIVKHPQIEGEVGRSATA